jgi:hypothetical protein
MRNTRLFALGIAVESPQRGEDLERIARPEERGERPKTNIELYMVSGELNTKIASYLAMMNLKAI